MTTVVPCTGQSTQFWAYHGRWVQEMGGFRCGARGTLANKAWLLCASFVGSASSGKACAGGDKTTLWQTWQVLHWVQWLWAAGSVGVVMCDA